VHRALIVEDLPTTRTWLAETLREAFGPLDVEEAGGVEEALALVRPGSCDIALVDLTLPDGDGVRVVKALARLQPQPMVVVASIHADDGHLFPALQAGAQGYVLKDESREDLVRTLRGIRNGQPPLSPAIARRLLGYFQSPFVREAALSRRESETLKLLARGLRLGDIAQALGVTRNTASEYIKSVYRKLDVSSRAEAAIRASHLGLVD
jgi:DNA-binding NarL/FixJ family response regulator